MHNVTYQYGQPMRSQKRTYITIAFVMLLILAVALLVWRFWFATEPEQNVAPATQEVVQEESNSNEPQAAPLPNLQSTLDEWVSSAGGKTSVFITDADGNMLASHQEAVEYFTASIYKLYVAYIGYQKIDDGTYSLKEPYLTGKTRGQCLDAMIRDSDSPCGEKMWDEFGKQAVTENMRSLGLTNTSLVTLTTSAKDASIVLQKIQTGEGLSKQSQAAFLDSMKTQDSRYRRGLPSGFSELTVFNKVGWNLSKEWHDAAIVRLPDGRAVTVSVFTENVGYQKIAQLGTSLEQKLTIDL